MFIDEVKIEFISGNGGAGALSFHREKHIPLGGPNGADGGKGGHVILIADRSKRTLLDLKNSREIKAEDGTNAFNHRNGKDGQSYYVKVPIGTIIYNDITNEMITDLCTDGMEYQICRGGRGGFGNLHFVSSSHQAPRIAEKGEPAEVFKARLELKLLADVGLIGLPNAGKSTLLSRISAAKPKIADYPFTTITPNLGVVRHNDSSFTVADMPGLIEGASEGIGLGHQFLKHVERTKILVHMVDVFPIDETSPLENFQTIENELKEYSEILYIKPRIIALNKIDLISYDNLEKLKSQFQDFGFDCFTISGATGKGLQELLYKMDEELLKIESQEPIYITPVQNRKVNLDLEWNIEKTEDGFMVTGARIFKLVAMTNLANKDALMYLHRKLERIGVIAKLRDMGAEKDDSVFIGDCELKYSDYF